MKRATRVPAHPFPLPPARADLPPRLFRCAAGRASGVDLRRRFRPVTPPHAGADVAYNRRPPRARSARRTQPPRSPHMDWQVDGADRQTGEDKAFLITADTEGEARAIGEAQDIYVSAVVPYVNPDYVPPPAAAQPDLEPPPHRPPPPPPRKPRP